MCFISRCRMFALVAVLAMAIAPAAAARPNAHKPPAGGSIVVHGHWTIVVRNHAGAIVTRRTFENSYVPGGLVLPSVLGRINSVGLWSLGLPGTACGSKFQCTIAENGYAYPSDSSNLTVTTGASGAALVLSGSLVASSSGQITGVASYLVLCSPTVPPATPCVGPGTGTFTDKRLGTAVNVTAGQQIAVTVTFTFS